VSALAQYRSFVTVLALGLMVAGCSGSGDPPPVASTTAATPTASASPSPSPSGPAPAATAPLTGPLRVTAGMTRPGTRLRFGQKAIVPIRQYNPRLKGYLEGVLGIVVQPIRSIPGSALGGSVDDQSAALLKKNRVYYVKIVITNESGNPMPLETPRFDGLRGDGESSDIALHGGELPDCEDVGATGFDRKGARWVTCDRWVSPPSAPITQVRYLEAPYGEGPKPFDDARFNRHYNLGPLTWR
jgi:hypothetical protein